MADKTQLLAFIAQAPISDGQKRGIGKRIKSMNILEGKALTPSEIDSVFDCLPTLLKRRTGYWPQDARAMSKRGCFFEEKSGISRFTKLST